MPPYCYNPSMEMSNTSLPPFGENRHNFDGSQRMNHIAVSNFPESSFEHQPAQILKNGPIDNKNMADSIHEPEDK